MRLIGVASARGLPFTDTFCYCYEAHIEPEDIRLEYNPIVINEQACLNSDDMPSSDPVLTGGQGQSDHTAQLRNRLWENVASSTLDNIFSIPLAQKPDDNEDGSLQGTRYNVDEKCRQQLQAALCEGVSTTPFGAPSAFPPTDVLNQGLDLFIRQFHPALPFIHLPTFSAKNAPPLLLYTMCLTGMVVLGTKEALNFVRRSYLVCASPGSMERKLIILALLENDQG